MSFNRRKSSVPLPQTSKHFRHLYVCMCFHSHALLTNEITMIATSNLDVIQSSQIHHSVIESFGANCRTYILSRLYPTQAEGQNSHLAFLNNGESDIQISKSLGDGDREYFRTLGSYEYFDLVTNLICSVVFIF